MKQYISTIFDREQSCRIIAQQTCATYQSAWESCAEMLDSGELSGDLFAVIQHRYTMSLCAGRHEMPVQESIFPGEISNPADMTALHDMADAGIPADCDELVVYVTGLTAAMLAVVQVCAERHLKLTAMHYDRGTGKYFPQVVIDRKTPFMESEARAIERMAMLK